MQEREGQVNTAPKGRGRKSAEPKPQNNYPSTAEALRDLGRFLEGQAYLPDVQLQMETFMDNLNSILDDEVVASYEEMFERSIFIEVEEGDTSFALRMRPAYEQLKRLRDLQKARLRDGLQNILGHKDS